MANSDEMPRRHRIKRYATERLYDASRLAYFDIEQLRDFVSAGDEVVVVDAADGADITAELLPLGR